VCGGGGGIGYTGKCTRVCTWMCTYVHVRVHVHVNTSGHVCYVCRPAGVCVCACGYVYAHSHRGIWEPECPRACTGGKGHGVCGAGPSSFPESSLFGLSWASTATPRALLSSGVCACTFSFCGVENTGLAGAFCQEKQTMSPKVHHLPAPVQAYLGPHGETGVSPLTPDLPVAPAVLCLQLCLWGPDPLHSWFDLGILLHSLQLTGDPSPARTQTNYITPKAECNVESSLHSH
jgi:hypothetical protein